MSNNFEKKQFSTISENDFNSLISVIPHSIGNIYSHDPFETLTGYYHNNELIAYKADLYMAGSQILITDEFISYIDLKELEDGSVEPLQTDFNRPIFN